jgi:hypothetical protein
MNESLTAWRGWAEDEGPEWDGLLDAERHELRALSRQVARRRRRNIFGVICAVGALAGLFGLVPALRWLWYLFLIDLIFLMAFVGLSMYAARIEADRDHPHRTEGRPLASDRPRSSVVDYLSPDELIDDRSAMDAFYEHEDRQLVAKG